MSIPYNKVIFNMIFHNVIKDTFIIKKLKFLNNLLILVTLKGIGNDEIYTYAKITQK